MSWLDRINDNLSIQTGDGKVYKPQWINANIAKEFHVSEFEFVNLPGTLADRRLPKGNRYNLEIHFQGDNHLDIFKAFYKSTDDPKYWILQHPFYENINVQPLSINVDHSTYNISKITIPLVETIIDSNHKTAVDQLDSINVTKIKLDEDLEKTITSTIKPVDINSVKSSNNKAFNFSVPIITLPKEFQDYTNAFNQANSFVDSATAYPILAIRSTIALLTMPAKFTSGVKTRINTLSSTFNELNNTVLGLTTVSGKQLYQAQSIALVSAMCLAASLPNIFDYRNNRVASSILTTVNSSYQTVLSNLDFLQSLNGGNPDSFIPDFNAIIGLNNLINSTISYLYNAVIFSRKERSIITDSETSIVLLASQLYGLDISDSNIDDLLENNELSFEELVLIKKGRKIIYYL
jgi:hypothetical protein